MKKYILFRHNDLDGCGAGIVANVLLGEENVHQVSCSNWNVDEKIKDFLESEEVLEVEKVFIVDLCPNEVTCKLIDDFIRDYSVDIVVYDHHVNECSNSYCWYDCTIENDTGRKECGTTLFYENEVVNYPNCKTINLELLESIRLYDTWEWKEKNTFLPNQLNTILYMIGEDEFIKYYSNLKNPLLPEKFLLMLKVKEREKEEYINKKLKNVKIKEFNYIDEFHGVIHDVRFEIVKYAVVLSDYKMFSNELMDRILEEFDVAFVMGVYDGGISLRTNKDYIDVGEIARIYNGGGRQKTAGFKYSGWYEWLKL